MKKPSLFKIQQTENYSESRFFICKNFRINMPQVTLLVSNNIDVSVLRLDDFFIRMHELLRIVPSMDVNTVHSGVIQESYSYIGLGNPLATKMYLQLYWMENPERLAMKATLAKQLMADVKEILVPSVVGQGLICIPRVRIANLGQLNQDYFIG